MYEHILIATDGSDLAQRAVEQGLALAKVLGSTVTAVTVTEPWTAAVSGEWAVAFPVEEYERASGGQCREGARRRAGGGRSPRRHLRRRPRQGPVRGGGHRRGGEGAQLRPERLAHDLEVCFNQYQSLLDGINTNPFGSLADFKNNLQYIIKYHPVLIQYYYDFIYDLIKAFYEFRYKVHVVTSECCGDEMKFPFHLMLGEAAVNTTNSGQSAWRQYFIYSPLFDGQTNGHAEVKSLLMRMVLMYQDFLFTEKSLRENRLALQQAVRVTPSRYGHSQLSERCIPYYYKAVQDKGDPIPGDLYYYWNYRKDQTRQPTLQPGL